MTYYYTNSMPMQYHPSGLSTATTILSTLPWIVLDITSLYSTPHIACQVIENGDFRLILGAGHCTCTASMSAVGSSGGLQQAKGGWDTKMAQPADRIVVLGGSGLQCHSDFGLTPVFVFRAPFFHYTLYITCNFLLCLRSISLM
jgi:hypothetical protein